MLPLGPPDRHRSPYKAASAFAAWPGLLGEPDAPVSKAEELDFREREHAWIEDWARFGPRGAVADQVRFDREWAALRRLRGRARREDHRRRPDLRRAAAAPTTARTRSCSRSGAVAGTPPDAYTDKGQLWGNPLYDWPAMQRRGYRWWTARLARTFELFDLARIDHFRGFVAYWAVPAGAQHALSGSWKRGPGRAVFDARGARAGPRAAADRRGPRRHHPGGRAPARRPRLPGHGDRPVRLQPRRPAQPAPPRQPRREPHRLHRHPRPRHRARLVRVDRRRGARDGRRRDRRAPACASPSRGGR